MRTSHQTRRAVARKATFRPRARKGAGKPARRSADAAVRSQQMWSAAVTHGSNALDLEPGVFAKGGPRAVARSLKRSAEQSRRRKAGPFQSAMSMLSFYINRAGKSLSRERLQVLERAKGELRKAFGRVRTVPPSRRTG